MHATQLLLDFRLRPLPQEKPSTTTWLDVTDLVREYGFHCTCQISQELHEHLDEQALYDAIWTACFTHSLNGSDPACFTIEANGRTVRFKAFTNRHALQLERVNDF